MHARDEISMFGKLGDSPGLPYIPYLKEGRRMKEGSKKGGGKEDEGRNMKEDEGRKMKEGR